LKSHADVHVTVPLPDGESLMPHVKYLLENRSNELCVGDVFQKLLNIAEFSTEHPVYDSAKKKIIMKALSAHLAVERVVVNGFKLMSAQLNRTGYMLGELLLNVIMCVSSLAWHAGVVTCCNIL